MLLAKYVILNILHFALRKVKQIFNLFEMKCAESRICSLK